MTATKKTRRPAPPARGSSVLYLRGVRPALVVDMKALAAARGWTLAQLLSRLLELRSGSVEITLAYPDQRSAPLALLLEKLDLDARSL